MPVPTDFSRPAEAVLSATKGMKVIPRVEVGFSPKIILRVAEEEDVSLAAMSSAGENVLRDERIGNVTDHVANAAYRPVLILKLKRIYNYVY